MNTVNFFKKSAVALVIAMVAFAGCEKNPEDDPKPSYTVTFDAAGGSIVAAQTVEEGGTAARPEDPTCTGYVFDNWYLGNASAAYSFNTPVTADITLTAKWLEDDGTIEYWNITWNLNGGAWTQGSNPAEKVIRGRTLAEPNAPVKEGSAFEGWYSEAALTSKITFPCTVTADMTLYAKWTGDPPPTDDSPFAELAEGLYKIDGENYTTIQVESGDVFITNAFAWIETNSNGTLSSQAEYVLVLDGKTYSTIGEANELTKEYTALTVYGKQNAVIQLTGQGTVFGAGDYNKRGIKLVLDGYLTLKGIDNNKTTLLDVSFGAIAEIKGNVKITNNRNADERAISGTNSGGGVYVYDAMLIMDDNAEISAVSYVRSSEIVNGTFRRLTVTGGGVFLTGSSDARSTLIMKGNSKIKDCVVRNAAQDAPSITSARGGGVYLADYCDLIMEDNASITDNAARHDGDGTGQGGGVYVNSEASLSMTGASNVENNIPDNIKYQE